MIEYNTTFVFKGHVLMLKNTVGKIALEKFRLRKHTKNKNAMFNLKSPNECKV